MKKIILILGFALAILSCSKDDPQSETPVDTIPKVKTIAYGSDVSTFTYDSQGRIVKKEEQTGSKSVYIYNNNTVTENRYNDSGELTVTYLMDLNTNGLVSKSTLTFPTNINHLLEYTYNANKQVATIRSNSGTNLNFNYIDSYDYLEKSLDNVVRTLSDGTLYGTTYYDYYLDKTNTLSNKNMGMSFYAEESDFPEKKVIYNYYPSNVTTFNYLYEFDAKNRISKKIINSGIDGINEITYY